MKKFLSILTPIIAIFLLVGGTYYYLNSEEKNFKEEHAKYLSLINDDHDFNTGLKGLETLTTEKAKETLKNIDKEITIATDLKKADEQLKEANIETATELIDNAKSLDNEKNFDKAIFYINNNIENYNKAYSEILELENNTPNYKEEVKKIVDKYKINYKNLQERLLETNNENEVAHTQSDSTKEEQKKSNTSSNVKQNSATSKKTTKSNTQTHPRIIGQQVPETYNTIRYTEEGSTSRSIIENELKGDIANFTNEEIDEAIARYNSKNNG